MMQVKVSSRTPRECMPRAVEEADGGGKAYQGRGCRAKDGAALQEALGLEPTPKNRPPKPCFPAYSSLKLVFHLV